MAQLSVALSLPLGAGALAARAALPALFTSDAGVSAEVAQVLPLLLLLMPLDALGTALEGGAAWGGEGQGASAAERVDAGGVQNDEASAHPSPHPQPPQVACWAPPTRGGLRRARPPPAWLL